MKIVHICLGCFYIDNYSYQENLLPKYHKLLGNDVEIIASTVSFDKSGNSCYVKTGKYINENNINVTRLSYYNKFPYLFNLSKIFRKYCNLNSELERINPDIIFIHGCQFIDIKYIVKYARKNNVVIYVDNHADFSNSARNFLSRYILHGIIWKHCAQEIEPYTKKFYGVLPARVEFLKKIYKLPSQKCDLLVMGADDEIIEKVCNISNRKALRKKYNIKEDDFVLITGGKIDSAKKQIFLFLDAVLEMNNPKIKVIIFGTVVEEMKERLLAYCKDENICFVGWLNTEETYQYLSACDLAVYPGRHSVLWEQTVGIGLPMIVKFWEGTTHIDVGGNVVFIKHDDVSAIKDALIHVLNKEVYDNMKAVSLEYGKKIFSYKEIARKSIK